MEIPIGLILKCLLGGGVAVFVVQIVRKINSHNKAFNLKREQTKKDKKAAEKEKKDKENREIEEVMTGNWKNLYQTIKEFHWFPATHDAIIGFCDGDCATPIHPKAANWFMNSIMSEKAVENPEHHMTDQESKRLTEVRAAIMPYVLQYCNQEKQDAKPSNLRVVPIKPVMFYEVPSKKIGFDPSLNNHDFILDGGRRCAKCKALYGTKEGESLCSILGQPHTFSCYLCNKSLESLRSVGLSNRGCTGRDLDDNVGGRHQFKCTKCDSGLTTKTKKGTCVEAHKETENGES